MDLTDLQITSRDNTIAYLTTRAEQAVKDAVEMAKLVQQYQRAASIHFWNELDLPDAIKQAEETDNHKQAQTIIDKYKETT